MGKSLAKTRTNTPPDDTSAAEKRENRRKSILQAAELMFAQHGYANCDMEGVAAQAQVAKGTVYLYFASKAELFLATVEFGAQKMQKAVQGAAAQHDEPFDKIAAAVFAYLQYFDQHPHFVELLIQERASFKQNKQPVYFSHRDANRGPWRQLYTDLMAAGRVRQDLAIETLLDTIGNVLYGTMFSNYLNGRPLSLAEQCQAILELVFRGALTDAERIRWEQQPPAVPKS